MDDLKELELKIKKDQDELERLKRLKEKYPDLVKNVNRWKTERWCSALVNPEVTEFEYRHNCGCCTDSPVEIWPYLETVDGRVYTNPPCFRVGKGSWNGDLASPGWQKSLVTAGIHANVIERIGKYLGPEYQLED